MSDYLTPIRHSLKGIRQRRVCLPHPHDNVSVEADYSHWVIAISYIGRPNDLLAAGVIEPDMIIPSRVGVTTPRRDSNGNTFRRLSRPNGRIEVERRFADAAAACRLPGVNAADCMVWGVERQLERSRGRGNFTAAEVLNGADEAFARARRPKLYLVVNNDAGVVP